jgi:rare lipoprotein A
LLCLLLAGCGSTPPAAITGGSGVAHGTGAYRVGVPYQVKGVWYYPAVNYNYDRTGIASWYGEAFEGRLTANGEIFDLNELTAAHTTLPMPSIVEVTNLENGRSLQLRVNDRGPFVDHRLIDLSRRSAQLLGFEKQGTTLVRVRVLKAESIAAAEEAMHGSGQTLLAAAAPLPAPAYAASLPATPRRTIAPSPPPVSSPPPPAPPLAVAANTPPPSSPAPQYPMPPPSAPAPSPQLAMASSSSTLIAAPPPPRSRSSRFSLIAPAEAAELPPPLPPRRSDQIAALISEHPTPIVEPKPATALGGANRLFVQAGAFTMRENAVRVRARVAHLGGVEMSPVTVHGVAMYRVRLGPLASEAQAKGLLARVVDSGCPGARIVGD